MWNMYSEKFLKALYKTINESQRELKEKLPADLVTFTEEILNEKLHFLSSGTPRALYGYSKGTRALKRH